MNIMAMSTLGHHCYLGKEKNKVVRKVNIKEDLTLVGLLKDCAKHKDFHKGIALHDALFGSGLLEKNSYVTNTLIHMYVKCGMLAKAQDMHDNLLVHNLFSWNVLISGYVRIRKGWDALIFFELIQIEGLSPDVVTFTCMIKACVSIGDIDKGIELHKEIILKGLLEKDIFLGNSLVDMYAKTFMLAEAQQVLEELPNRDVCSWTSLISGYAQHGQCQEALYCFEQMQNEGLSPNEITFSCILNACCGMGDIDKGKQIHDEIIRTGLLKKNNSMLGNALVDMYAKCGAPTKAQDMLDELAMRNIVSWNALILGYSKLGKVRRALACFCRMQTECLFPNEVTFTCILKACGMRGAIDKGKKIHDEIIIRDLLEKSPLLGTALVDMYAKCGVLEKAQEVLNDLSVRDVISWSSLIVGYTQYGKGHEALKCFEQMQKEGLAPDTISFICVLKACAKIGAIEKGKQIHKEIKDRGLLGKDTNLGASLVDMYAKCGMLAKAQEVFDDLLVRNVVSWSSLIVGYAEEKKGREALQCLEGMRNEGIFPDAVCLLCILMTCSDIGAIDNGKEIHIEIMSRGLLEKDSVLGNALVDMYAKIGVLGKAQEMFDDLLVRDVVSWSALIAGYVQQGEDYEALKWFQCMEFEGLSPNEVIFTSILQACGGIGAIDKGKQIHEEIVIRDLLTKDIRLGNALVDMYAKCGMLAKSQQVFDELPIRNIFSWNALIWGYVEEGEGREAMKCVKLMHRENIFPNGVTFTCILKGCGDTRDIKEGKQIHNMIVTRGWLEENVVLGNALVDMYAKCGALAEAHEVLLKELHDRDSITWSSLIARYVEQGQTHEALKCFEQMQGDKFSPNEFTFTCVLDACSGKADIEKGRQIHDAIVQRGSLERRNIVLGSAVIKMYAKCGELSEAQKVLDGLPFRDLVMWNILISSYAKHGDIHQVFNSLRRMQREEGLSPDAITFIGILKACSTTGAVGKGKQIHNEIVSRGFLGKHIGLGNSLVDMYAKCGMLGKAQEVLESLPLRDVISWGALIGGYATQGQAHKALSAFIQMQMEGVSPNEVIFLCLMNAYSHSGKPDEAQRLFEKMITQYGIIPTIEHYTCMVVTFGFIGNFDKANSIMNMMSCSYRDSSVWRTLICACRKWGNIELAKLCLNEAILYN